MTPHPDDEHWDAGWTPDEDGGNGPRRRRSLVPRRRPTTSEETTTTPTEPTVPAPLDAVGGAATAGPRRPARVLLVGGDPEMRASLADELLGRAHRCTHVSCLDDARRAVGSKRFDVVVVHASMPDGDSLAFVKDVRERSTGTRSIVFAERPTLASAVAAIRSGAVDVVTHPEDVASFVERVETAIVRSEQEEQREERIRRLTRICRELDEAREEISGQVEELCREMVRAYEDLTTQLDEMAMTTEFRTLLRMELDVEEVLRTTLEYLLTKTGPTNAAVFLPDVEGRYSLGAYVNYDCPRDHVEPVLGHLADVVCPHLGDETEILRFDEPGSFADWMGVEADGAFTTSSAIAFACRHEGECLGVAVLFRGAGDPFPTSLDATLDALRSIFAEHLGRVIDVHHRAEPEWPEEAEGWEDEDFGLAA